MYGINFATEKNLNAAWKLRFEYAFTVSNQIHYRSNGTGSMENCDYNRWEMRALASYNINPSWDTYFGLGYRNLQNDGSDKRSSTGHTGYFRDSRYTYLPVGVAYTMPYKPLNFSITTKAEYDHILYARQYSAVNVTGTNTSGTYNRQKNGFGARVSIDGRQPGDQVDWLVGAFVRHWNFKNSKISGALMEPKNRTFEIGAKVGIAF